MQHSVFQLSSTLLANPHLPANSYWYDISLCRFIGLLNHILSQNSVSPKKVDDSRYDSSWCSNVFPIKTAMLGYIFFWGPRGQLGQNHRLQAATEAATDTGLAQGMKRSRINCLIRSLSVCKILALISCFIGNKTLSMAKVRFSSNNAYGTLTQFPNAFPPKSHTHTHKNKSAFQTREYCGKWPLDMWFYAWGYIRFHRSGSVQKSWWKLYANPWILCHYAQNPGGSTSENLDMLNHRNGFRCVISSSSVQLYSTRVVSPRYSKDSFPYFQIVAGLGMA